MEVKELSQREKRAFKNIKYAANDLIGGLENTLLDYDKDSTEYKSAQAFLSNHDALVNELYNMSINAIYGDGFCAFSNAAELYLRDIRFCGKDRLIEFCENRVSKLGY